LGGRPAGAADELVGGRRSSLNSRERRCTPPLLDDVPTHVVNG
jgi:hypothetical protein